MSATVALIPSPLNGPAVWAPVCRRLRSAGVESLVLDPADDGRPPYWIKHANAIGTALNRLPSRQGPILLVGHSGAGPLLPAIGAFSPHPIAGYLFVDAGLPLDGDTRLDEIAASIPEFADDLRQRLLAGGSFPQWSDEEAWEVIPDNGLRAGILGDLHPRALDFFTEPIPAFAGWPDAPCGYIKFSRAYDGPGREAQGRDWHYREFNAGHFHMLVDPEAVAEEILTFLSVVG